MTGIQMMYGNPSYSKEPMKKYPCFPTWWNPNWEKYI